MNRFSWMDFAERASDLSKVSADSVYVVDAEIQRQGNTFRAEETLYQHVLQGTPSRIIITGRPGSGKSFLMDRLNMRLANNLLQEIRASREAVYVPNSNTIVPLLIRLRRFMESLSPDNPQFDIEQMLVAELGLTISFADFLNGGPKFVFLFDDLDEVTLYGFERNLMEVRNFLNRYPTIQSVIAGRQIATRIFDPDRTWQYNLLDISPEMFAILLQQVATRNSEVLLNEMNYDADLLRYLCTPFFAIRTGEYWNRLHGSISNFRLGRLLDDLLKELIDRQRKTEYSAYVDTILGKRETTLRKLAFDSMLSGYALPKKSINKRDADALEWLQHMEFVKHDRTQVEFTSRWIQAMFAAQWLRDEFRDHQEIRDFLDANIEPFNAVKSACIQILADILPIDLSDLITRNDGTALQFSQLENVLMSRTFETLVADYVRHELGFDEVISSYKAKYLDDDEIDVFAKLKRDRWHSMVLVAECKYRRPPLESKSVREDYISQLLRIRDKVANEQTEYERRQSRTVTVSGVLITNGGRYPDEIVATARKENLSIWEVSFPVASFIRRQKISRSDIRVITGKLPDSRKGGA